MAADNFLIVDFLFFPLAASVTDFLPARLLLRIEF